MADASNPADTWPRDSAELIDALTSRGIDPHFGIYGGLHKSTNRLGDVDAAILLSHGHLNLRLSTQHREVELLIWQHEGLAIWGTLKDLDEAAEVVRRWSADADTETICRASQDLHYDDGTAEAAAIDAQWRFVLEYGHGYLMPIAEPVSRVPVLRSLKPWVSHGTLHLLDGNFLTEPRRQIIFHPTSGRRWIVRSSSPASTTQPLSIQEAVAVATDIATERKLGAA